MTEQRGYANEYRARVAKAWRELAQAELPIGVTAADPLHNTINPFFLSDGHSTAICRYCGETIAYRKPYVNTIQPYWYHLPTGARLCRQVQDVDAGEYT